MSALVGSILEKAETMNVLCRTFGDYTEYKDLNTTVNAFFRIIPSALVIAINNKPEQIYWVKEVDVVLGNVNAMFHNLYSSAKHPDDAIISMSFGLIQKDLANYLNALNTYIGRSENATLKRFARTLDHHRSAPDRWCFIRDKKCVPVLSLVNDILFEDWVPE